MNDAFPPYSKSLAFRMDERLKKISTTFLNLMAKPSDCSASAKHQYDAIYIPHIRAVNDITRHFEIKCSSFLKMLTNVQTSPSILSSIRGLKSPANHRIMFFVLVSHLMDTTVVNTTVTAMVVKSTVVPIVL